MKHSSIVNIPLLAVLIACVCWSACKRHTTGPVTQHTPAPTITPPSWVYNRLHADLKNTIDLLQSSSLCHPFHAVTQGIGKPYWGKNLSGERGDTKIFLVPLKMDRDSLFAGFVAIEKDSTLRFQVYSGRELDKYSDQGTNASPTAFDVNHALNALNHYGFGKQVYSIAGIAPHEKKRLDRLTANASRSIAVNSSPIVVSSCYHWSTCMGDGKGNCVGTVYHFTECVSQILWTPPMGSSPGGTAPKPGGSGVSGGGGGSTPASSPATPPATLAIPQKPIANVKRHLECFNTSYSAKVTLYVDQPTPGTTDPVSILGGIGHTFLSFEQQVNGKLIRRTIGFYAQTPIDPMKKKSGASMLGDDAGRKYDVKWETYVGGDQLSEMLSGAIHYAGTYHIENYNCANFALDILSMGGIQLPRTEGWWITGRGLNPGNLGEDIRQLPGSVGMKGNSPDNAGTCQPPKVFF